jgi:hypothetical protein
VTGSRDDASRTFYDGRRLLGALAGEGHDSSCWPSAATCTRKRPSKADHSIVGDIDTDVISDT